jgi:head-tail adaptor
MTGSMAWQQTETILADTTHRVTARYAAMKDMAVGDYLMYEGRRFDIQFILNPFESNWMLEFYCQEMKDT